MDSNLTIDASNGIDSSSSMNSIGTSTLSPWELVTEDPHPWPRAMDSVDSDNTPTIDPDGSNNTTIDPDGSDMNIIQAYQNEILQLKELLQEKDVKHHQETNRIRQDFTRQLQQKDGEYEQLLYKVNQQCEVSQGLLLHITSLAGQQYKLIQPLRDNINRSYSASRATTTNYSLDSAKLAITRIYDQSTSTTRACELYTVYERYVCLSFLIRKTQLYHLTSPQIIITKSLTKSLTKSHTNKVNNLTSTLFPQLQTRASVGRHSPLMNPINTTVDASAISQHIFELGWENSILAYLAFNPQIKICPSDLVPLINHIQHAVVQFSVNYNMSSLVYIYMFILSHLSTFHKAQSTHVSMPDSLCVKKPSTSGSNSTTTTTNVTSNQNAAIVTDSYAYDVLGLFNPFKFFCEYLENCLKQDDPITALNESVMGDTAEHILGLFCYVYGSIPSLQSIVLQGLNDINHMLSKILSSDDKTQQLRKTIDTDDVNLNNLKTSKEPHKSKQYKRCDAILSRILSMMVYDTYKGMIEPWNFNLTNSKLSRYNVIELSVVPEPDLLTCIAFYHKRWLDATLSASPQTSPLHDIITTIECYKGLPLDSYIDAYSLSSPTIPASSEDTKFMFRLRDIHSEYHPLIEALVTQQDDITTSYLTLHYPTMTNDHQRVQSTTEANYYNRDSSNLPHFSHLSTFPIDLTYVKQLLQNTPP